MSFGLTNALITFQKYVNWVLWNKLDQEEVVHVDNILVTEQNQVTNWKKMQKIMMKLYTTRLRAKLAKCRFKVLRVKFLEYVVRRKEVSTDPEKTKEVQD